VWPGMFAYQFLIEAEATRFYDEHRPTRGTRESLDLDDA